MQARLDETLSAPSVQPDVCLYLIHLYSNATFLVKVCGGKEYQGYSASLGARTEGVFLIVFKTIINR